MSYKQEFLAHKKSSLGLLYYCSISRKPPTRKETLNVVIDDAIKQIRNASQSLTLKVNAYLLGGLVNIWKYRKEIYRKEIINMLKILNIKSENMPIKKTLKPLKSQNKNTEINPNVSDSNPVIFNTASLLEELSDFESSRPKMNDFQELFVKCNEYNFEDFAQNTVELLEGTEVKLAKKTKYDKKTILSNNGYRQTEVTGSHAVVPNICYENCLIMKEFLKILKEEVKNKRKMESKENNSSMLRNTETSSLARNTDSSSINKNEGLNNLLNEGHFDMNEYQEEINTEADWFYEILIKASRGEIRVIQEEAFGELKIIDNNNNINI
ncbi:hypothetical protein NUSPORA_01657 [Nucleospora cyclopteri]